MHTESQETEAALLKAPRRGGGSRYFVPNGKQTC